MRSIQRYFRMWLLLGVVAILTIGAAAPAHATWYVIHGHSGHVQDENVNNYCGEYGWGLDFEQKPGTGNWIQFAVPSLGNTTIGVRFIRLYFYTAIADA